jgi:hypothetical protein
MVEVIHDFRRDQTNHPGANGTRGYPKLIRILGGISIPNEICAWEHTFKSSYIVIVYVMPTTE